MAGETIITIIGNTTAPVELRFTPGGDAVASFTVASTPRTFDKNSNAWKDGETLFMRCSAWRELGENAAQTLDQQGTRVIVSGFLKQRSYEKDGEKRTVVEMEVQEIGPSLKYATAKIARTPKGGNGGGQQAQQQGDWNTQPANVGGDWGNGPDSEPPF